MRRSFSAFCGIFRYIIAHFGSLSPFFHTCRALVAQHDCSILQYKKNIYMAVYMLLKNLVDVDIDVYAGAHTSIYIYGRMRTYIYVHPRAQWGSL